MISVSWAPALNGAAPTGFILIVTGTYSLDVPIAGRSISAPVGPGTYTLSVAATNPCGTSAPTAAQTVASPRGSPPLVDAPLLLMMAGRDVSSDPTNAEKGNTEEQEPRRLRQSKARHPVTRQ